MRNHVELRHLATATAPHAVELPCPAVMRPCYEAAGWSYAGPWRTAWAVRMGRLIARPLTYAEIGQRVGLSAYRAAEQLHAEVACG